MDAKDADKLAAALADTEAADDLRTFVYDRTGIMLSMEGIGERFARHRLAERARIVKAIRAEADEYRRFGDFASEAGVLFDLANLLESEKK